MKSKIIVFTNLFPYPWEPQRATFNRQQIEHLSSGYDLQALVPISWLDWLKVSLKKTSIKKPVTGIKVTYFRYFYIPKMLRWSYGLTLLISTLRVLPKLIGKQRPTVIYSPWAYPDGFVAVILGKLLHIPVVIKVLGTDINVLPLIFGVKCQIAWTLKHAAGVVAVSQDLANKVISLGSLPENTHVIYDGVNHDRFKPINQQYCRDQCGLKQNLRIILYVGNLLNTKGCLDLVESFSLVKQQIPDVILLYVGKGDDCAKNISKLATQRGINEAVHILGTKTHDEIAIWMNASNIVVLPSYNEGVPNVLLEAMACGVPVVATNVGGIPEVVPDYAGVLIKPGDRALLADALIAALSRSWDTTHLIDYMLKFSWEKNISELKSILNTRIDQHTKH